MPSLATKGRTRSVSPPPIMVTDLTAGLERRVAPSRMKADRARRLRNVRLSVAGEWTPRPGWETWLDGTLGATTIQGAARIYLDGVAAFTLAAESGEVFQPSDAGVAGSAVLTGLDANAQVFFPYDPVLAAVFDGVNVPQKTTDGTTWAQFGISPPGSAPTLAAAAGGSLVDGNTYEFSYSYEQESGATYPIHGSNEGPRATQAVAGANLSVTVTVVASADPQVDKIYVWARDVTAGEGVRRFAGSRANTNGDVSVTTNNWSSETEAPTRRTVPPALAFGVAWKNRWWAVDAADRTVLRFSELFENQSWPATYNVEIPFTRGDAIAGMLPIGDVLVVFGESKQAFLILAQTSLDFEVRPAGATEAGCFGPRAIDAVEDGIIHAGAEGVYLFNLVTDRLLSYDFEGDWRDMVAQSSTADLQTVGVHYHRRDKEVRITAPTLAVYGTPGEWILDLARTRVENVPAWATTDRAIAGYVAWDGVEATAGNRGRLFSWGRDDGLMYEESVGLSADGADLIVDYEGPVFATELRKARFIDLFVEIQPAAGTLALQVKCDGATVFQPSVSMSAGGAQYGSSVYGTGVYAGSSRTVVPIMLPLEAEGGSIQVIGEYTGQARPIWFTYGLTVSAETEIRGI